MIPLSWFLGLGAILFVIGALGVMMRRNAIVVLMSIELMLNGANINFVAFASYMNDPSGQYFALFSMALAAAEVAVGLAILLVLFGKHGTVELDKVHDMGG